MDFHQFSPNKMSDKILKAANNLTIAVTLRLRHLLLTKKLDSSSASSAVILLETRINLGNWI